MNFPQLSIETWVLLITSIVVGLLILISWLYDKFKSNSQQPDVKVNSPSLGEGESAGSIDSERKINSGYSEGGKSEEYPSVDTNKIEEKLGSLNNPLSPPKHSEPQYMQCKQNKKENSK